MTESLGESDQTWNNRAEDLRPKAPFLETISRCNMSCPICISSSKWYRNSHGAEMGRRRVKDELLEPGKNLAMIDFTLSGGEPTLCDHLLGTLEEAVGLDYTVHLATNLRLFGYVLHPNRMALHHYRHS
jgi:MoaA/NifB/PqqE/SkfB family radical SAM enzyme